MAKRVRRLRASVARPGVRIGGVQLFLVFSSFRVRPLRCSCCLSVSPFTQKA
jgi:hypothetical protein